MRNHSSTVKSPEIIVYEPDNSTRQGYISLWKEMVDEVRKSKWLTYQFFLRDVKSMYKQSFMGVLWSVVVSFAALGSFIVLNSAGVVAFGELDVPYPVYAVAGLASWQVFSTGIVACAGALAKAGTMISKINFPRESLVVGSMGQALIAFLIQIVVVIAFLAYYQIVPHWMTVFVPLTFIPVFLLTLGLGLILSLLNAVARDVERGIAAIIPFLLFVTPIMYAKPQGGALATLTDYNPVYYLVAAPRDLALTGHLSEPMGYLYSVVFSVGVFVLAWMAFHLTETRIAERI